MKYNDGVEFINLIRTIVRQELNNSQKISHYWGTIASKNPDNTCNIKVANDPKSIVKNIKNNSSFTVAVNDIVTVLQLGDNQNNAFIIDRNGSIRA